jgi:hypothetical protein
MRSRCDDERRAQDVEFDAHHRAADPKRRMAISVKVHGSTVQPGAVVMD